MGKTLYGHIMPTTGQMVWTKTEQGRRQNSRHQLDTTVRAIACDTGIIPARHAKYGCGIKVLLIRQEQCPK